MRNAGISTDWGLLPPWHDAWSSTRSAGEEDCVVLIRDWFQRKLEHSLERVRGRLKHFCIPLSVISVVFPSSIGTVASTQKQQSDLFVKTAPSPREHRRTAAPCKKDCDAAFSQLQAPVRLVLVSPSPTIFPHDTSTPHPLA